jgi:hypothetical protein
MRAIKCAGKRRTIAAARLLSRPVCIWKLRKMCNWIGRAQTRDILSVASLAMETVSVKPNRNKLELKLNGRLVAAAYRAFRFSMKEPTSRFGSYEYIEYAVADG